MKQITSLNVIRIFLLLAIFSCHGSDYLPQKLSVYAGELTGFALEIFFIVSGFCCALSLLHKERIPRTKEYIFKKIRRFYPLHIITLSLCFILQIMQIKAAGGEVPVYEYALQVFLDIFLLQSWTWNVDYVFAFNGVAWFLSSLVFCYIATPLALKCIKKSSIHPLLLLLIVIVGRFIYVQSFRYFIDFGNFCFINVFPPYRFLEYLCGMILACYWYKHATELTRNTKAQIFGAIGFLGAFYIAHASLQVSTFTSLFIVFEILLVSSLVFYTGKISDFGATRVISYLSGITFEFYLLHRIAMRYFLASNDWLGYMPAPDSTSIKLLYFVIMLVLAVALSAAWHAVCRKRSSRMVKA